MKRKNLLLSAFLILTFVVASSQNSYSQWVVAGSVSGAGTSPSISVVDQNTAWIAGGVAPAPAIFRTTNGGTTWTTIPTTGISIELYCIWAVSATTAYVGDGGAATGTGGNAKFYKTTDAGVTWTVAGSTGGTLGFINGIVFSKTQNSFGIVQSDPPTGTGNPYWISKTTDGGVTWTVTNPPGVAGAASGQNSIFVVNSQVYGFGNNSASTVILTTDGGTTWNNRTTGLAGTFMPSIAFADNGTTGITLSSASLPNIARTTNGGATWTIINTGAGLTSTNQGNSKWINGTNTCYIAGTTNAAGVIRKSTDGGLTWTTMTTAGLTNISHMEFIRSGTNAYGYAVTSAGAVLKLTDAVTGVNTVNSLVPSEYRLEQNYPNPFNPTTNINFSLPKSSNVSLKVYDALGKEVATLVNEFRPAGNYTAEFNAASNLTSGIYFYTLTSENFTSTKKLMLVK